MTTSSAPPLYGRVSLSDRPGQARLASCLCRSDSLDLEATLAGALGGMRVSLIPAWAPGDLDPFPSPTRPQGGNPEVTTNLVTTPPHEMER